MSKYTFNHNFFKKINTENKAYWLGFILADGCISHKELIINLKKDDANHLQKFLNDIQSNHCIRYTSGISNYGPFSRATISLCSKIILYDLFKLGIKRRKTWSVKPPKLNIKLQKHFWRGVIDGDGSISNYIQNNRGKSYLQCEVNLTGNRFVIKGFKDFLLLLNINAHSKPDKKSRRIAITGKKAKILLNYIYHNANIFLDRKYQKYLDFLQSKEKVKIT